MVSINYCFSPSRDSRTSFRSDQLFHLERQGTSLFSSFWPFHSINQNSVRMLRGISMRLLSPAAATATSVSIQRRQSIKWVDHCRGNGDCSGSSGNILNYLIGIFGTDQDNNRIQKLLFSKNSYGKPQSKLNPWIPFFSPIQRWCHRFSPHIGFRARRIFRLFRSIATKSGFDSHVTITRSVITVNLVLLGTSMIWTRSSSWLILDDDWFRPSCRRWRTICLFYRKQLFHRMLKLWMEKKSHRVEIFFFDLNIKLDNWQFVLLRFIFRCDLIFLFDLVSSIREIYFFLRIFVDHAHRCLWCRIRRSVKDSSFIRSMSSWTDAPRFTSRFGFLSEISH